MRGQNRPIGQEYGKIKFSRKGLVEIMKISTFAEKFYVKAHVIKYIDSKHRFIGELFYACGSDFFPKIISTTSEKYWTARSLFTGKRRLTTEMRESFPQKFNEKKFVEYFSNRINEKNLSLIAKNFAVDANEIKKELFLIALCKQFQVIIHEELDSDKEEKSIVNEEYQYLLKESIESEQNTKTSTLSMKEDSYENRESKALINLWLPDAELATEEQAGLESFTPTESSKDFMNPKSGIWGIRSAKGVGKTYLLQKMRRDMSSNAIPQCHKLSKDNEWGTESIRFDDPTSLEKATLTQLAGLWKVSILCLVINCVESSHKQRKIDKVISKNRLPEDITLILEDADLYMHLNSIVNRILIDSNWRSTILKNYTILRTLCNRIIKDRLENQEDSIMIFIDKVDQSILQPGAEIPECNDCYKDTKYDECIDKDKGVRYCLEECRGCCYGCEKFASPYAGGELRIYGSKYGKRYEHISQWQHLQLALVLAVDHIRLDFESKIQVYYAIRQEAFNAEDNLLGANATKIKAHTTILHYSKEEQEKIFNNTIKVQPSKYLYNPKLITKGNYAEAFIGVSMLCHPYVAGTTESIFDCIYRHSFDRAREIQCIGDELARNMDEIKRIKLQSKREEKVKRIIESKAADLLFLSSGTSASGNRTYFNDKQILLPNYWANPDNFKNFIQEIDRNLLFIEDLAYICKKVNGCSACSINCKETNCEHHPFSMLYQIGLLGRASYNLNIDSDSEQIFIASKDITYYRDKAEIFPDKDTLYILHPALTKCIEINIRGSSIMHFCGFVLGKGLSIARDRHKQLLDDRKNMDKKTFESMYYSKPDAALH